VCLTKDLHDVVFEEVAPERDKRGGPAIHDENSLFGQNALEQDIESPLVDLPVLKQLEVLRSERSVLCERLIDGISVDALNVVPLLTEVLRENAGDQRFADAPFTLQLQVYAAGGDVSVSLNRCVFRFNR
jgi:hypothetical protein